MGIRALLAAGLLLTAASAPAGDRFVVITDSHGVGRFGVGIASWRRSRGSTEFELFASGGAAPMQWWSGKYVTPVGFRDRSSEPAPLLPVKAERLLTPTLATLWKELGRGSAADRRVTVIVQGTNIPSSRVLGQMAEKTGMSVASLRAKEVAYAERLVREALAESDACVWVGPPETTRSPDWTAFENAHKVAIVRDALESHRTKHGKTCAFVDSRSLSSYPNGHGDGIHYHLLMSSDRVARQAAETWAEGVSARIEAALIQAQSRK
jgi:hypothetical protein